MIYSKRESLPSYAPHRQAPPPSFPRKRESNNRKTTGLYRKKQKPHTVIPANAGIQKRNTTGIYRKNPNPNGLNPRLRGNDEILSWGNLSENPNPKNRADAAPSAPKPFLTIQTNRKRKQNEQNIPHHLEFGPQCLGSRIRTHTQPHQTRLRDGGGCRIGDPLVRNGTGEHQRFGGGGAYRIPNLTLTTQVLQISMRQRMKIRTLITSLACLSLIKMES